MEPKKTILIIDDVEAIREVFQYALSIEGYDVLTAENGKDALELLANTREKPNAILLDVSMPIMDGIQFMEIFRKDETLNTIPVIVMSAYGDALIKGGVANLAKPFETKVLLDLIKEHGR